MFLIPLAVGVPIYLKTRREQEEQAAIKQRQEPEPGKPILLREETSMSQDCLQPSQSDEDDSSQPEINRKPWWAEIRDVLYEQAPPQPTNPYAIRRVNQNGTFRVYDQDIPLPKITFK